MATKTTTTTKKTTTPAPKVSTPAPKVTTPAPALPKATGSGSTALSNALTKATVPSAPASKPMTPAPVIKQTTPAPVIKPVTTSSGTGKSTSSSSTTSKGFDPLGAVTKAVQNVVSAGSKKTSPASPLNQQASLYKTVAQPYKETSKTATQNLNKAAANTVVKAATGAANLAATPTLAKTIQANQTSQYIKPRQEMSKAANDYAVKKYTESAVGKAAAQVTGTTRNVLDLATSAVSADTLARGKGGVLESFDVTASAVPFAGPLVAGVVKMGVKGADKALVKALADVGKKGLADALKGAVPTPKPSAVGPLKKMSSAELEAGLKDGSLVIKNIDGEAHVSTVFGAGANKVEGTPSPLEITDLKDTAKPQVPAKVKKELTTTEPEVIDTRAFKQGTFKGTADDIKNNVKTIYPEKIADPAGGKKKVDSGNFKLTMQDGSTHLVSQADFPTLNLRDLGKGLKGTVSAGATKAKPPAGGPKLINYIMDDAKATGKGKTAIRNSLTKAVKDGKITQRQADDALKGYVESVTPQGPPAPTGKLSKTAQKAIDSAKSWYVSTKKGNLGGVDKAGNQFLVKASDLTPEDIVLLRNMKETKAPTAAPKAQAPAKATPTATTTGKVPTYKSIQNSIDSYMNEAMKRYDDEEVTPDDVLQGMERALSKQWSGLTDKFPEREAEIDKLMNDSFNYAYDKLRSRGFMGEPATLEEVQAMSNTATKAKTPPKKKAKATAEAAPVSDTVIPAKGGSNKIPKYTRRGSNPPAQFDNSVIALAGSATKVTPIKYNGTPNSAWRIDYADGTSERYLQKELGDAANKFLADKAGVAATAPKKAPAKAYLEGENITQPTTPAAPKPAKPSNKPTQRTKTKYTTAESKTVTQAEMDVMVENARINRDAAVQAAEAGGKKLTRTEKSAIRSNADAEYWANMGGKPKVASTKTPDPAVTGMKQVDNIPTQVAKAATDLKKTATTPTTKTATTTATPTARTMATATTTPDPTVDTSMVSPMMMSASVSPEATDFASIADYNMTSAAPSGGGTGGGYSGGAPTAAGVSGTTNGTTNVTSVPTKWSGKKTAATLGALAVGGTLAAGAMGNGGQAQAPAKAEGAGTFMEAAGLSNTGEIGGVQQQGGGVPFTGVQQFGQVPQQQGVMPQMPADQGQAQTEPQGTVVTWYEMGPDGQLVGPYEGIIGPDNLTYYMDENGEYQRVPDGAVVEAANGITYQRGAGMGDEDPTNDNIYNPQNPYIPKLEEVIDPELEQVIEENGGYTVENLMEVYAPYIESQNAIIDAETEDEVRLYREQMAARGMYNSDVALSGEQAIRQKGQQRKDDIYNEMLMNAQSTAMEYEYKYAQLGLQEGQLAETTRMNNYEIMSGDRDFAESVRQFEADTGLKYDQLDLDIQKELWNRWNEDRKYNLDVRNVNNSSSGGGYNATPKNVQTIFSDLSTEYETLVAAGLTEDQARSRIAQKVNSYASFGSITNSQRLQILNALDQMY